MCVGALCTYELTIFRGSQSPPEVIGDRLVQTFTGPHEKDEKCIYEGRHKDLLTSYILITFLHVCDFNPVPVKCLSTDLGVPSPKMREYCVYAGCKSAKSVTAGAGAVGKVKLTVPLTFPERRKRTAPRNA